MILQYLLLAACALILAVSCIRAPKNALFVHLSASPMWALVAMSIIYGWQSAVAMVITFIVLHVAVRFLAGKFISRGVGNLLKKFNKSCKESLRHFANSAWWLVGTGPLLLAAVVGPHVNGIYSKYREKREGGDAK